MRRKLLRIKTERKEKKSRKSASFKPEGLTK